MKFLVCGVGSVGERHIRNLLTLGERDIAVFRSRNLSFRTLDADLPAYTDLGRALAEFRPDAALITNPTSLHLPVALECARGGCHLLIEKPVSHLPAGLDTLQAELDRVGRVAMVGYMLRFHPLFRQVRRWLDAGDHGPLGRVVFLRSSWGEHLPDWHPWEDYRTSYAAREELGGGPALTLSHELDLVVWMLGAPDRVLAMANRASPLETSCEHAADFLLGFPSGATANVHLDYFQRPPHRSWELVGTRGRVSIDYYAGRAQLWRGPIGEIPPASGPVQPAAEIINVPAGFDRNQMFLDELRHFLDCIRNGHRPEPGLAAAAESVRVAQARLCFPRECPVM